MDQPLRWGADGRTCVHLGRGRALTRSSVLSTTYSQEDVPLHPRHRLVGAEKSPCRPTDARTMGCTRSARTRRSCEIVGVGLDGK
jgi:hypothetical protein